MTTKKAPPLIPWNTSIGKECANYKKQFNILSPTPLYDIQI